MRADRERGIGGARAEAQKMGEQARAIVEDYDQKLTAAKRRGADERNKLQKEATARERELLGKARADVQTALDSARRKIAADTETGRAAMTAEAGQLARKVASKALGREVA
jgi:F0F1-type ATP synthase membrane subunit b/b'